MTAILGVKLCLQGSPQATNANQSKGHHVRWIPHVAEEVAVRREGDIRGGPRGQEESSPCRVLPEWQVWRGAGERRPWFPLYKTCFLSLLTLTLVCHSPKTGLAVTQEEAEFKTQIQNPPPAKPLPQVESLLKNPQSSIVQKGSLSPSPCTLEWEGIVSLYRQSLDATGALGATVGCPW